MEKLLGFIIGAIIGLIAGGCVLFQTWLSQYINGLPWFIALFLKVMGAWLIAKCGITVAMWPYMLSIPAAIGGIIGFMATHD